MRLYPYPRDAMHVLSGLRSCAVMHRVASADGSPVSVASIRGYVASLSGAGIVEVHNTTGTRLTVASRVLCKP